MKEILIDRQIGASFFEDGITAEGVRADLQEVLDSGEREAVIRVDSLGGSVWECFSIFTAIKDFARANPQVSLSTRIMGKAASSASVIALAAKCGNPQNKILCEDNSVFMIHNAWTVATGDYREMEKEADLLLKISETMAKTYDAVCKKGQKEVQKLMDRETWWFGSEIVENGFADEVVETAGGMKDKALAFASAWDGFAEMKACMKDKEDKSMNKVAALMRVADNNAPSARKEEGFKMTVEELKQKEPALYASIFDAGAQAGAEKERSRVSALMKMGAAAGCYEVADGFIRDGKSAADEDVAATFFEKRVAKANLDARAEDEPAAVATPVASQNEAAELLMAGFDKTFGKR